ncbi:hypothetical protein ES703_69956 [subsurface metagenome]
MKIRLDPLDILFSQYIRLKAGGICEYCNRKTRLQCSHFHGRRKRSVRWDEDNASALCFTCHLYMGENPYVHTEWFKQRLGSEKFEALNRRAEMLVKVDREAIKTSLKERIKLLGG